MACWAEQMNRNGIITLSIATTIYKEEDDM